MKKFLLILILASATFAQDKGLGTWSYIFTTWSVNEDWTAHLYLDHEKKNVSDYVFDNENYVEKSASSLFAIRFRRKINDVLKIGLNYGQFHYFDDAARGVWHRAEVALLYGDKMGDLSWSHRSRIERRYIENSQLINFRYRHQWTLTYALPMGFGVGVANEFMRSTGSTDSQMPWGKDYGSYQNYAEPLVLSYKIDKVNKVKVFYRITSSGMEFKDLYDRDTQYDYLGLAYFVNFK